MPGPTSDKAQELSNKTTKSSKRPSRSNQGGTSIAQQAKGSKAAFSIAKPEIPAKFDKKSQLREAQEQEWDIDTLFATTKKAKKKDDTAAQVNLERQPCKWFLRFQNISSFAALYALLCILQRSMSGSPNAIYARPNDGVDVHQKHGCVDTLAFELGVLAG